MPARTPRFKFVTVLLFPVAVGVLWRIEGGSGTGPPCWLGPAVLGAHVVHPFLAFALQPARPWRLLLAGVSAVVAAECAVALSILLLPNPGEWAAVAAFGFGLLATAYAIVSALIVGSCVLFRDRCGRRSRAPGEANPLG